MNAPRPLRVQARELIRDIPDFPKPGILFRDITPLLADGNAFRAVVNYFADLCMEMDWRPDYIVGPEARGFIFASALAYRLGVGFVPVRKPNKLPYKTTKVEYALEYGTDSVEMHIDAIASHHRVLLIDDLLATGGTIGACTELLKEHGVDVQAALFLVELSALNGREALGDTPVHSLVEYAD